MTALTLLLALSAPVLALDEPPPPPPEPPPAEEDSEVEEVEEVEETIEDRVGGVEGGVVGGVEGGALGGQRGDMGDARMVHWSEVKVKRQVQPQYPEAAKQLDLGDVTCKVRFFIDEKGIPTRVELEQCPKVFHESTEEAMLKWRFYPYKHDGRAVPTTFLIAVKYVLR